MLAGGATSVPKRADGAAEALRLIKVVRDPAVKARTQAMNLLRAALVTSPDELRAELRGLTPGRLIAACAELPSGPPTDPASASAYALRSLAKRWLVLDAEVREHTGHLQRVLEEAAPELLAAYGVGPDSAAELVIAAGDNGERIRNEAAFAKLCGVCPVPASSGRTTGRHRLNRGGNRKANAALHRVVIVRLKWHEPTRAYMGPTDGRGADEEGRHPVPQTVRRP